MSDAAVTIRGEEISLLPERAVHWPGRATLLVADTHIGKAAAFRTLGVPVPRGTTTSALARLAAIVERTDSTRVIFLGDLLHAREGLAAETLDRFADFRRAHPSTELVLVRGNHERGAGDPPASLGVRCVDAPMIEAPFVFTHHPGESHDGYVMAGHVHPAVHLTGPARARERLPCFWLGAAGAVLPAFGDFLGFGDVEPAPGDAVFVIADDEVIRV